MEFGAAVKLDSMGQLRGAVRCTVTPQGLSVAKGKAPPLLVPVGTPARHEGGSRMVIKAGGRVLTLSVSKFGSYPQRIARDVAAFLRGERPAPLAAREYKIEPYLLVPSLLPFGIMAVTGGGAIPGAIGGALAVACLAVAQVETLHKAARLAIILAITAAAYGVTISLVAAALWR